MPFQGLVSMAQTHTAHSATIQRQRERTNSKLQTQNVACEIDLLKTNNLPNSTRQKHLEKGNIN